MFALAGWLAFGAVLARGKNIVQYLHNGDRIAGTIVSEDTNRVVLTTSWIKELAVPLSAIQRRESVTNAVTTVAPAKPEAAAPAPKPKLWKGKLSLGTDTQIGAPGHQLYTGRLNLNLCDAVQVRPEEILSEYN